MEFGTRQTRVPAPYLLSKRGAAVEVPCRLSRRRLAHKQEDKQAGYLNGNSVVRFCGVDRSVSIAIRHKLTVVGRFQVTVVQHFNTSFKG